MSVVPFASSIMMRGDAARSQCANSLEYKGDCYIDENDRQLVEGRCSKSNPEPRFGILGVSIFFLVFAFLCFCSRKIIFRFFRRQSEVLFFNFLVWSRSENMDFHSFVVFEF